MRMANKKTKSQKKLCPAKWRVRLDAVEVCMGEEGQTVAQANRMPHLSSIPRRSVQHHCGKGTAALITSHHPLSRRTGLNISNIMIGNLSWGNARAIRQPWRR